MNEAGMKREEILREDSHSISELALELQDTEWPFEFTDMTDRSLN